MHACGLWPPARPQTKSQLGISQSPELEPREDWAAGAPAEEDLVPHCPVLRWTVLAALVLSQSCVVARFSEAPWRPTSRVQKCGYEPTRTF